MFTLGYFFAVPGPPQDLAIVGFRSRYVALSWTPPPEEDKNGELRQYIIHVVPEQPWLEASKYMTAASVLFYTVHGLHPYSNYSISVAAYTIASGPNSTAVQLQTQQEGEIHISLLDVVEPIKEAGTSSHH